MFWLKIGTFFIPILSYVAFFYGSVLSIGLQVKIIIGAIGFLFGGLVASSFQELERWFQNISDVYGSANFATAKILRKAGLFGKNGLLLGRHSGQLVRFDQPGHMLTISPTRGGKTSCAVIPCLLDYMHGPIVAVDIKGELFDITARFRRTVGPVFKFAPHDEDSHCFNPFDFIGRDLDAETWEDSVLLAEMLVVPTGEPKSAFFENEAKALLTGLILYVATEAPHQRRNLAEIRRMIMLGDEEWTEQINIIRDAKHPLARRMADSFSAKEPKLQTNILATAQSQTLILDSDRVKKVTSRSDFSLEWLKENVMTLYLVVPPERLHVYRPLIRIILGMAVNAMTRPVADRPDDPVWRRLEQYRDRGPMEIERTWQDVLRDLWRKDEGKTQDAVFLVDEFPSLGSMRPLAPDGIAYLAGYGVKMWFFSQSVSQLVSVYGENIAKTIIANCNLQAFSNTDNETLETLSRMLGNETRRVQHKSKTRHSFVLPDYDAFNLSAAETGRPLLTPDEIRCLGDDRQLLFLKGLRPILAKKTPYYKERRWRGTWDRWRRQKGGK